MKPLPLDNVLRQLLKEGLIHEKSKFASVYGKPLPKENDGFVSKVFGYFFSGKQEAPLANEYFFKSMVDDTVALARTQLSTIFKGQNALPEGVVIRGLEQELYLRKDGDFLLDVLL